MISHGKILHLMKYYAVKKGRSTGVFASWTECSKNVTGFKGAEFKSFTSLKEAQDFINLKCTEHEPEIQKELVIYTDGACRSNGSPKAVAGYGVYYGDNDTRNISRKLLGPIQTNNRAELMAVIEALNSLDSISKATIFTDSTYVEKGLYSWISNWKKNNWKTSTGNTVLNQDLWKILDECRRLKPLVKIKHVKAHSGIIGNEMADRLAVAGCFL